MGPKFSRAERNQINLSRFYAIGQIKMFPQPSSSSATSRSIEFFERSCEIGLWRLTANRISQLFGVRLRHKNTAVNWAP